MIDFNDCLDKRKIMKANFGKNEIINEIILSNNDMVSANKSYLSHDYRWSIVQSYYSMYHMARGLLFSKGYRDKIHYCVYLFLVYLSKNNEVEMYLAEYFKGVMFLRTQADYEGIGTLGGAEKALSIAKEFNDKIRPLLGDLK